MLEIWRYSVVFFSDHFSARFPRIVLGRRRGGGARGRSQVLADSVVSNFELIIYRNP
jgi:hypothetical protein